MYYCLLYDALCRKKASIWEHIEEEYNANNFNAQHRTIKALKSKFDNMKKTVKKKVAAIRSKTSGTGGGKKKDIYLTWADERLLELMGTRASGLPSEYDEDGGKKNTAYMLKLSNWEEFHLFNYNIICSA